MDDERHTLAPVAGTAAEELAARADWLSGRQRARALYQPEAHRHGRALCLSGGGYRATLFHLGALTRLNELGVLGQIDTFCSVSGGSIASALLADRIRAALAEGRIASWPHHGPI